MGYFNDEAPDHEGWVTMTYADGKVSSGTSTSAGHYLDGYKYLPDEPGEMPGRIDPAYLRPYDQVTGWLPRCSCGWSGTEVPVAEDAGKWREPSDDQEDALMDEWRRHIAPFTRTARVRDLADRVAELSSDLAAAVREAKGQGASWTDLGRALGVSKQAAQQRYGG